MNFMDGVRNKEVRIKTGVKGEIARCAEQSMLKLFGHVGRIVEHGVAKRKVNSSVEGVRQRGRSKKGQMISVKKTLACGTR